MSDSRASRLKKRRTSQPIPVSRETLARIAHIVGESSAAARALAEYDRRIAAKIPTAIYNFAGHTIVGDPIRDLQASEGGGSP